MKPILIYILISLLLASCGGPEVAGTNSETDTAFSALSGKVIGQDKAPAPGVLVRVLPAGFDPRRSDFNGDSLTALTDSQGRFSFKRMDRGDYIVTAEDGTSGFNASASISLEPSVEREWAAVLKAPSSLRTLVPLRFVRAGAYVYVTGTLFHTDLDTLGSASFEGVPSGPVKPILAYEDGLPLGIQPPVFAQAVLEPGAETTLAATGGRAPAFAKQVEPGDDLQAAIDGLLEGDTLLLAGGLWEQDGITISSRGTASDRIYISAASGETPLLRGTSSNRNLVEFNGAAYVTVSGLEIDSTASGRDAFKFSQSAASENVVLRNCHIHHIRGIGINSEGSHSGILIEDNHIHHVYGNPGEGIRVGGTGEPSGWTIRRNWIHDLGYGTPEQGYGITLTRGCRAMTVRDNIIHDVSEAGILNYGTALANPGPEDMNVLVGNAVWNALEALGLYGDVVAKNNVLFECGAAIFSSNRTGRSLWNVKAIHNTIYGCEEVRLNAWNDTSNTIFVNNAVYGLSVGMTSPEGAFIYGNVGDVARADFTAGEAATDLRDPGNRDFYPLPGGELADAALVPDTSMADYSGADRDSAPDVGAFEYIAGFNDATIITEGFKP